jgi:hypothetical protein
MTVILIQQDHKTLDVFRAFPCGDYEGFVHLKSLLATALIVVSCFDPENGNIFLRDVTQLPADHVPLYHRK